MCYDDDDYAADLTNEWRKARVAHDCYACREVIPAGHRYHIIVQKYDGELCTAKHCARCWRMLEAIIDMNGSAEWGLDCGVSWQEASGGEIPEDVARLAFLTPEEAQEFAGRRGEGAR